MQSLEWTNFVCYLLLATTLTVSGKCFSVQTCKGECKNDELEHKTVCAKTDHGVKTMTGCEAKCSQSEITRNDTCTKKEDEARVKKEKDDFDYTMQKRQQKRACESKKYCTKTNTFCGTYNDVKKGQCEFETVTLWNCRSLVCEGVGVRHGGKCTEEELEKPYDGKKKNKSEEEE